ncbi:MAG: TonB-dependent receptor [Caulobacteraceae bacterium]|nr:TonB-dependent receptor [Caulobacteraceae bacterium]
MASASGAVAAEAVADNGAPTAEIIVTATKRNTRLQETPVAITALNATALTDQHVNTIEDVTHLVPSFQATSQGDHGVVTLTLRGVGNDSAKTEYADPEVAMFVDGVYSPRAEGATALLFDLDALEVDRGPQGTLWGRNSTVGAVNMMTSKPKIGAFGGDVQAGVGDYGRWGVRGAINLPITDTLAFRVAFVHEQHDGYVDYQRPNLPSLASQQAAALAGGISSANFKPIDPNQFVQGGPKYDAQDQTALRLSGLWQPTDRLTWNFSYEYFQDRGTPNINLMQNPRPGASFWSALIDTAPYLHRDVHTFRSRVDYRLTDYLGLDYIAGYSRYTGASAFDQDGGTHVPTSFATGATFQEDRTNYSRYTNYSHEVEVKSLGKHTVDWILGLYYAAEDNAIRFDIPIMNGTSQGTVSWQGSFIQPKETVESKAVFGQATWNLGERFHLTVGARYTDDHRGNEGGTNNGWAGLTTVPQVPIDPSTNPLTSPAFSTYQHNDGSYHSSRATWLARADADITKNFLVYASVSTGYKSGGLQDGGLQYKPETVTNYEIGSKNTFFGGRVTWNNAVYYEEFKGYQFSAPVTFADGSHGLDIVNIGGSTTVVGFESELSAQITRDDHAALSFATLHTKAGVERSAGSNDYSNLPVCTTNPLISNCVDITGHALPHAPSAAVTFLYQHDFHLPNGATLSPRLTTHYETESWLSLFHDGEGDKQKAYTRTDLGLKYAAETDGHAWSLDFYVQNVEDGRIRTSVGGVTSDNIYISQYLPPRTFGANLKVKF